MTTAKKKPAKKPAAKKAPAKKAPAKKKAAPKKAAASKTEDKSKFVDSNKFFEEVAAAQIALHAEKVEQLIDSIPAQVTVDASGFKGFLRKFFRGLSK